MDYHKKILVVEELSGMQHLVGKPERNGLSKCDRSRGRGAGSETFKNASCGFDYFGLDDV